MGSDNGLAPVRQQAIIWTNDGLVYGRIYAPMNLILFLIFSFNRIDKSFLSFHNLTQINWSFIMVYVYS